MKERWGHGYRTSNEINLVVDIFTKTHEPVGSKARYKMWFNPVIATIRNLQTWLPSKNKAYRKAHTSVDGCLADWFSIFCSELAWSRVDWWQDIYQVLKAFDFEAFKLDDILDATARWRVTPQWFRMLNRHVSAWLVWNYSIIQSRCLSSSDLGWIKACHRQFAIQELCQWLGDLPSTSSRTFYWK